MRSASWILSGAGRFDRAEVKVEARPEITLAMAAVQVLEIGKIRLNTWRSEEVRKSR